MDIIKASASAPSKLMLVGEHAVVYGYPCIVTAVDLRHYATITRIPNNEIVIDTSTMSDSGITLTYSIADILNLNEYQPETSFVVAAIKRFYTQFNISSGIELSTDGPAVSYGLGSSSAITVATIAALADVFNVKLDQMALFDLAYDVVLDVQGTGSGFDVASAVFGGTLYYQLTDKIIEPLAINTLPLIIGFSGKKVSTTSHVKQVAELRDDYPELINTLFEMMGDIAKQAKIDILNSSWDAVGALLNMNQGLLDALGVNTIKLATLISAARESGAFGAKLSGAGGGDCMFALVSATNRDGAKNAIEQVDGYIVDYPINAEGVRIEDSYVRDH